MLDRMRSDEGGFTLIELLVVILIVGILAAIALPSFLGQQDKGKDASAKSNARNAVTQVESCLANPDATIGTCDSAAELGATGLDIAAASPPAAGEVFIAAGADATQDWVITAMSDTDNTFTITKLAADGTYNRSCTRPATNGGCPASLTW